LEEKMATETHDHPNYFMIWVVLLLLLVVSLAAVYMPFSQTLTVILIFVIAAVKALLVASFFMHLKIEGKLILAIAIVPVILFVIMTISLLPDIVYNPVEAATQKLEAPKSTVH